MTVTTKSSYLFIVCCCFVTLLTFGQISIQLPESPTIDTIQKSWKGHNHGAFSDTFLFNNQVFVDSFSTFHPGIIRWPAGNRSQNYKWEEHLSETNKFNLKNVIPFLNQFGVDLQVVTNFGNGSATESAEFVKFCNSTDPYYTNLRDSLLSSPNPIKVKYWEIGNESTTAWSFAWSWLGFQDNIRFRTGEPLKPLLKKDIDSLYYYGGDFFREGWVEVIGGINLIEAILGDLKFYENDITTDTITIDYPKLDVLDTNAVRVYRTSNFDQVWSKTLGTSLADGQVLYDSISNPNNLLAANEYSWNETQVILTPIGGLKASDALLIEYNSTGHDGAFAFRNAMKAADPSIEIGYATVLQPELYNNSTFQQDFAASPPDFMIVHSYPGGKTQPLAENGDFSEVVYVAKDEINSAVDFQALWNQREIDWSIPNDVGIAITEWNINLYDGAPENHPHRGISGGMYVASFLANMFESAVQDSIDLRVNNHFALIASGNNFIHLFNSNATLETSVEGKATQLVMESIGEKTFPLSITNMPQIQIIGNQQGDLITIDAIEKWGGVSIDESSVNILFINRDDQQSYDVNLQIPSSYLANSISVDKLYGTMFDQNITASFQEEVLSTNNYLVNLPAFSVTSVKIAIQGSLGIDENELLNNEFNVFPNPASSVLHIQSKKEEYLLTIYDVSGRMIQRSTKHFSASIDVNEFAEGLYFFNLQTGRDNITFKVIKK
ncbi:MAG: T9SS type A sorting domain-containing protein [Flavobacteriaceae bacterium]|nr:T9SS type A sorting domain-containing protein [Flavobacteriaceae bacterium]